MCVSKCLHSAIHKWKHKLHAIVRLRLPIHTVRVVKFHGEGCQRAIAKGGRLSYPTGTAQFLDPLLFAVWNVFESIQQLRTLYMFIILDKIFWRNQRHSNYIFYFYQIWSVDFPQDTGGSPENSDSDLDYQWLPLVTA